MLIATATLLIYLFGGGGSLEFYLTNLKDPVKEHVQDNDRQDAILDASKDLSKELKDLQKEITDQFSDYVDLHSEYDSTAGEFDAVTEKMVASQLQLSKQVLDARDKMHEQMTIDEWRAVFGKQ
jgi:hypothetical protein